MTVLSNILVFESGVGLLLLSDKNKMYENYMYINILTLNLSDVSIFLYMSYKIMDIFFFQNILGHVSFSLAECYFFIYHMGTSYPVQHCT
jgi:hypothetical protein